LEKELSKVITEETIQSIIKVLTSLSSTDNGLEYYEKLVKNIEK
jgi:hypothetical protein